MFLLAWSKMGSLTKKRGLDSSHSPERWSLSFLLRKTSVLKKPKVITFHGYSLENTGQGDMATGMHAWMDGWTDGWING